MLQIDRFILSLIGHIFEAPQHATPLTLDVSNRVFWQLWDEHYLRRRCDHTPSTASCCPWRHEKRSLYFWLLTSIACSRHEQNNTSSTRTARQPAPRIACFIVPLQKSHAHRSGYHSLYKGRPQNEPRRHTIKNASTHGVSAALRCHTAPSKLNLAGEPIK